MRSFSHLCSHMEYTNAFFPGACRQRMTISTSTHWWLIRTIAMLSQTFCAAEESIRPAGGPPLTQAAVSAAIQSRNAGLPASIGIAATQGQSYECKVITRSVSAATRSAVVLTIRTVSVLPESRLPSEIPTSSDRKCLRRPPSALLPAPSDLRRLLSVRGRDVYQSWFCKHPPFSVSLCHATGTSSWPSRAPKSSVHSIHYWAVFHSAGRS